MLPQVYYEDEEGEVGDGEPVCGAQIGLQHIQVLELVLVLVWCFLSLCLLCWLWLLDIS